MSTSLRVSRGAVEKFRRYNEELPSQRIVVLGAIDSIGAEPDHRSANLARLRGVISLLKYLQRRKFAIATRVEESFLSGINFFIVLISSVSTYFAIEHLVCLLSLSPSSYLF